MRNENNDFRSQAYKEDEIIRFLREKAVKDKTGQLVKDTLLRVYIYIAGVPLWKKIRDVVVGWGVSYVLVNLILSFTSGDDTFHTMFPNLTPIGGSFSLMLAYYPVLVFWLHKTAVMSEEKYKFEEAVRNGKRRYSYRENKLHFKGYGFMFLFLLIWAAFIESLSRYLPALLYYPIISIPLFVQFLPEEIVLYKKIKKFFIKKEEIRAK